MVMGAAEWVSWCFHHGEKTRGRLFVVSSMHFRAGTTVKRGSTETVQSSWTALRRNQKKTQELLAFRVRSYAAAAAATDIK